ncbi:hypothetical protein ABJZ42_13780, partial [Enterococcus faecalis]|uniref:hypothetical protein n=1 Tax=Enterococcus faecalis TaxID=1351 RepID=UPI0032E8E65C
IVIPPAIFFYYSTLFDSRFKTLQQNPRDLSCIFFILSGFVRYTRKPKDNKNFILAESGFR